MVRVYLSGNPVHDRVLEAFYEGCPEEKKIIKNWRYEPADIAVVFGVFKSKVPQSESRGRIIRQQRENNLDVIVLETGYVNRGDGQNHHYAAGFNGLNGRADFRNQSMTDERWKLLNTPLKPYSRGNNVILCGQVPWDASIDLTGSDHVKWLKTTASFIQKITNRKIIFRPHPLADLPPIRGCEHSRVPLTEDLKDAHCVVTFNSNSAVEALIEGKPVFSFDEGSMVWSLCNKSLLDLEQPNYPDRKQWANNLAYAQWTPDEMRQGLAWRHLRRP
jgi:hypothetical protein